MCIARNDNEEDYRYFDVTIDEIRTGGVLLDLPCIIESMTTIDYINMFK
jgi:TATA-binding protein-associated factor Taf7